MEQHGVGVFNLVILCMPCLLSDLSFYSLFTNIQKCRFALFMFLYRFIGKCIKNVFRFSKQIFSISFRLKLLQ